MKDLLEYLISNITGKNNHDILETEEDGRINFEIKIDPEEMGIVIGKGGNTIKAIQTILRIKGKLENKLVHISVSEKTN